MPFEEYMAACLYDPEFGFFTSGPLRSVKEGDFLTSPEVSPWFGRMIARFVAREQERTGADRFLVVEVAAGSGSLLRPLMEALESHPHAAGEVPGPAVDDDGGRMASGLPHAVGETRRSVGDDAEGAGSGSPAYDFHAVEASPAARESLIGLLDPDNVHASFDDLPERFHGVIIANELLDNLPCALAIRSGDGWIERWVGATDDRFGFVTAPARPEVVQWCDAYAGNVPEGGMLEVQLAATQWAAAALSHLEGGALVVFDYGGTAEELEPRRTQGTLRTYRRHHLGPDPLLEPGATDVTVDVNFTAILAAAESVGAHVSLHRQDDFLADFGLRGVIRELRHRERELAGDGTGMERLIVRAEATDAETLLHPRGLGDFRVLVARRP